MSDTDLRGYEAITPRIHPEWSSTRMVPNKMMREQVVPYLVGRATRSVLDYGCGRFLRDSLLLSRQGMIVDAVDLEGQVQAIERTVPARKRSKLHAIGDAIPGIDYDAALLNFVIQTIPLKKDRDDVMDNVHCALRPHATLVLSLRNMRDIRRYDSQTHRPFRDGILLPHGEGFTFVRGYNHADTVDLLKQHGYALERMHTSSVSYVAIATKR